MSNRVRWTESILEIENNGENQIIEIGPSKILSGLIKRITKVRGANYYSVHSTKEFKTRMDDEFEYMVTPLVFDLQLSLTATGYEIEKVYGSPSADKSDAP